MREFARKSTAVCKSTPRFYFHFRFYFILFDLEKALYCSQSFLMITTKPIESDNSKLRISQFRNMCIRLCCKPSKNLIFHYPYTVEGLKSNDQYRKGQYVDH